MASCSDGTIPLAGVLGGMLTELLKTVQDAIHSTEPKMLRPVAGIAPTHYQSRSRLLLGLAAVNEAANLLEQKARTEHDRPKGERIDERCTHIEGTSREVLVRELGSMLDELLVRLERLATTSAASR